MTMKSIPDGHLNAVMLHTALSSFMTTMYGIQLFQNIFDISMIKQKNVHNFCVSEENEELQKRRKTIFEFPQNYTHIHDTNFL